MSPKTLMQESRERLYLAERIPLLELLDDRKTILTKHGSLVQVIRLSGKNYSGISQDELEDIFQKRKSFFNTLDDDVRLTIFSMRKKMDMSGSQNDYGNIWADKINHQRAKSFKNMYRTEIYIVVRMQGDRIIQDALGAGSVGFSEENLQLSRKKSDLQGKVDEIIRFLDDYQPKVLTHNPKQQGDLFYFWSTIANVGKPITTPLQSRYLGRILAVSDIEFFNMSGTIEIHDDAGTRYAAILGINAYPQETHGALLDMLMQVRHPFTVIQQVLPLNQEAVKGRLNNMIASMQSVMNVPIASGFLHNRMNELEDVGNLVDTGETAVVNHSFSILVYGDTMQELETGIGKIKSALSQHGVSIIREKLNLENAFWAQYPDHEMLGEARHYMVTTDNVSDFITFGSSYEGLTECAFGPAPVTFFKTRENTQFSFTFHATTNPQAAGHTMLIGPTGAGKSVLAMHLIQNCLKYNDEHYGDPFKALIFDSHQGVKIPVQAFGGEYINAGMPKDIPMNPLLLDDTPSNRLFLQEWLAMLVGGQENLSTKEKNIIARAVNENYELPKNERCLHALRALFMERHQDETENLYDKLKKWLPDVDDPTKFPNVNAEFFNSNRNALSFEKRLVGLDMSYCLRNKELLPPLAGYIFHAFTEYINQHPCPHICFVDEMAQYLESDTFGPFILKLVRESRKRNGVFFGAVQEPSVLVNNPNGQAIAENLATLLVLKNSRARAEEYAALGFTDREIEWIKTPSTSHEVMVKRHGGESIILNTDLSDLDNLLHLYSGKLEDVSRTAQMMLKNPGNWVDEFLEQKQKKDKLMNKIFAFILAFTLTTQQASALVVSDPGAYTRMAQQIQEAQKIYKQVQQQVQEIQRVYKNLEGNLKRGVGSIRDIQRIRRNIEHLIPALYQLTLPDGTKIDPSLSEDVQKAIDEIFVSPTVHPEDSELTEEQQRIFRQRTLKSSLSFSESILADIDTSLEHFETLAAQIDETKTLKDSQDLTNRYLQEILTGQMKVIMLLAQLARAEAALNYQGVANDETGEKKPLTSEEYLDKIGKHGSKYWKAKPEAESTMHELMGIGE